MSTPPLKIHTFHEFRANPRFNGLDGLRAFSILLVLLHHVPRFHRLPILQENGRYGVAFFFVISGFLICSLLLREEEKNGWIDLGKFYGRRALRLLPLYYAALALQAVLVFGLKLYTPENQALFTQKLPAYVFYYSNWLATATQGPFFQAWSLAVEEQFYLGFGLLLCFANRRWVVAAVLAALAVKFSVYQTFGAVDAHSTLWRVIFSYREPVLFGVLAAFALNQRSGYQFFQQKLGSTVVLAGICVGTVAWLGLHVMRHESFWDAQLLYVLMTMTVIGLVIRAGTPLIDGRLLSHIGKVSYGIYLLHMFVISAVRKLPGGNSPLFCLLISAVGAVLIASGVYKFFERPIIAFYKRKLSPLNSTAPVRLGEAGDSPAMVLPQCRIS